jgi:hypothetical protein
MKQKPRVRNYIARNRKSSGAGRHKNKRKECLNDIPKHKNKLFTIE